MNGGGSGRSEPLIVYQGRVVCHRPDQVYDVPFLVAPEYPGRIVRGLVKIVGKSGFHDRLDRRFAVGLDYKQVEVFGVAPAARVAGKCEPAAYHQTDAAPP